MIVVVSISVIALFLAILESQKRLKYGLKYGFMLITFLGCIHYDYGNDYMSYYDIYRDVVSQKFTLDNIKDGFSFRDPGWGLMCWLFKPFGGFFTLVAVLNIIQNVIIYKTIKREVKPTWRPFSFFIYLFNCNLYLISFTTMRQMFVAVTFFGLWYFIKQRKWVFPLIILIICSFIHSSAIILIPFSFWGYIPMRNGQIIGLIYLATIVILWIGKDILNLIFMFTAENNEKLSQYAQTYGDVSNQGLKIGLGFVINLIPMILSIYYLLNQRKTITQENRRLVALATVSSVIEPFTSIILLITRLTQYFTIYTILSYPLIYDNIKNIKIRIILMGFLIFITSYSYIYFFHNETWAEHFAEFKTIFPHIL